MTTRKTNLDIRVEQTLRSLQRFIYIRTNDPDALMVNIRDVLRRTYVEVGPLTEFLRKDANALANQLNAHKDPIGVCMQVVRPEDLLGDDVAAAFEKRGHEVRDRIRNIYLTILLGSEPATTVVPTRLRHMFNPIDLVEEPCDARVIDTGRVVVDGTALESQLVEACGYLFNKSTDSKRRVEFVEAFRGMSGLEVNHALSASVVDVRTRNRGVSILNIEPTDVLLNMAMIHAYRTRWTRVR